MMEAWFDIGGIVVRVTAQEDILDFAGSKLELFQIQGSPWDHWLDFSLADRMPEPKGELLFESAERRVYAIEDQIQTFLLGGKEPYMALERKGKETKVLADPSIMAGVIRSKTILRAMEAEHLLAQSGALLFHSSFICVDGRAVLFTAPSGTGKSTQAELWRRFRGAKILNGDRSVIRKSQGGYHAFGIPFCGSSDICEPACLPIAAIVVLSQAPENRIAPLKGIRAFRALWEGCSVHSWNREDMEHCSETLADLISQVPVFHLACTPDEGAVLALESELTKQR